MFSQTIWIRWTSPRGPHSLSNRCLNSIQRHGRNCNVAEKILGVETSQHAHNSLSTFMRLFVDQTIAHAFDAPRFSFGHTKYTLCSTCRYVKNEMKKSGLLRSEMKAKREGATRKCCSCRRLSEDSIFPEGISMRGCPDSWLFVFASALVILIRHPIWGNEYPRSTHIRQMRAAINRATRRWNNDDGLLKGVAR